MRVTPQLSPFVEFLEAARPRIELWLDEAIPRETEEPIALHQAMRYSVLAGGKRLRPTLALLAGESFGGSEREIRPAACALEFLHTYSLIHDDLPCMDDDDLRRGKPTCHKVYGEASAVLAGDGLLTLAFEQIASIPDAGIARDAALALARAAGSRGMVGGQEMDLDGGGKDPTRESVEAIHRKKTGALIAASLEIGAICARAGVAERAAIASYGQDLGLAFQIADDILDATSDAATLGKTPGKDLAHDKQTYPSCLGLDASRRIARATADRARLAAKSLGAKRAERFLSLADFVVERIS